jgi:hypothetical protein
VRALPRSLLAAAPILAAIVAGSAARAADPPAPAGGSPPGASAEALFDRGRKLMQDLSKLDEACRTLEESLKLADRGDTLLNLAECHRRQGKTATAWAEFDKALQVGTKVGFAEAVKTATQLRDDLAAKLSRLTVEVPPATAALEGFSLEVNGKPWPRPQWSKPAILDPGPVEVTAVAKGYRRFVGRVALGADKDQKTVTVVLEPEPPPPSPPKPPPPKPPPAPPTAAIVRRPAPVWPWIVGAAGAVLAGTAIGFEVDSQSAHKQLDGQCSTGRRSCPSGFDFGPLRSREVRGYGLFVGLGVGGILALGAASIGLGLSARSSRVPAAGLVLSPTSIAVEGTF